MTLRSKGGRESEPQTPEGNNLLVLPLKVGESKPDECVTNDIRNDAKQATGNAVADVVDLTSLKKSPRVVKRKDGSIKVLGDMPSIDIAHDVEPGSNDNVVSISDKAFETGKVVRDARFRGQKDLMHIALDYGRNGKIPVGDAEKELRPSDRFGKAAQILLKKGNLRGKMSDIDLFDNVAQILLNVWKDEWCNKLKDEMVIIIGERLKRGDLTRKGIVLMLNAIDMSYDETSFNVLWKILLMALEEGKEDMLLHVLKEMIAIDAGEFKNLVKALDLADNYSQIGMLVEFMDKNGQSILARQLSGATFGAGTHTDVLADLKNLKEHLDAPDEFDTVLYLICEMEKLRDVSELIQDLGERIE